MSARCSRVGAEGEGEAWADEADMAATGSRRRSDAQHSSAVGEHLEEQRRERRGTRGCLRTSGSEQAALGE
jgi:hypothetical protein